MMPLMGDMSIKEYFDIIVVSDGYARGSFMIVLLIPYGEDP